MPSITQLYLQYRRISGVKKVLLAIAIVLFLYGTLQIYNVVQLSGVEKQILCRHSEADTRNLLELGATVNLTLSGLKLTYFLCYDTLWAAIDKSLLYPWQDTVQFCTLNEEVSKLDEVFFQRQFHSYGLDIMYVDRQGYYVVKDKVKKSDMEVQIILFERFTEESLRKDEMRRIGWEHRIMPAIKGFDTMDTFPLWIIDKPLNTVVLNGLVFPGPKGGIEINKYLQPDTWWKDQTPTKCKAKKM